MKFDVVLGNPPYQDGNSQIYADFYISAIDIANHVCLIFPTGWQQPKNANNLRRLNNKDIKRDSQIVYIDNIQNAFVGVAGAEWTNVVLWRKGFDNNLGGRQRMLANGVDDGFKKLPILTSDIEKPNFIEVLNDFVTNNADFKALSEQVSSRKPYGLGSDIVRVDIFEKYGLPHMSNIKMNHDDIRVFSPKTKLFVPKDYPFPKLSPALDKYKVFVPFAWGNWSTSNGLGGAYADIYLAKPNDSCSESYLEVGSFTNEKHSRYLAKYLMTQFTRALIFKNKFSHNNTKNAYTSVPIQDFSEPWWDKSIEEINDLLFDKYNIPEDIRIKVNANIQLKDESNIVDLGRDE